MPNNRTNLLISKLVSDLRPKAPLLRPVTRCLLWCAISLIMVSVTVHLLGGIRADYLLALQSRPFIVDTVAILIASCTASFAAFRLAIPDTRVRIHIKTLLVIATLCWVLLCNRCFFMGYHSIGAELGSAGSLVHHCLIDLMLIFSGPLILVIVLLRRGASTLQFWAGYAALLAATSWAALAMRFLCPLDEESHLLVWHFLPVVLYAMCGMFVGQKFLKW